MKKRRDWIIIDIETRKALYGVKQQTLMFTSKEVAEEVAEQLFEKHDRYIIVICNARFKTFGLRSKFGRN